MTVVLRPARHADARWLAALVGHPEIAPFLAAVRASTVDEITDEIERAQAEPDARGVIVVEEGGAAVGTATWERVNRRSRIASVSGVAIDPAAQGRGIARAAVEELVAELLDVRGFHRVQLEVYGFNERAAALFARAGFVCEGVKRKAYWRDGAWVDGICFGLLAEDRASGSDR